MIYYCSDELVMPMYVFVKSDRADIPVSEIRDALRQLTAERTTPPTASEEANE